MSDPGDRLEAYEERVGTYYDLLDEHCRATCLSDGFLVRDPNKSGSPDLITKDQLIKKTLGRLRKHELLIATLMGYNEAMRHMERNK